MADEGSMISRRYSDIEKEGYVRLVDALRNGAVPDRDILAQLMLFQPRVGVSHLLFLDELYRQILNIPGDIAEFGVNWGRNMAAFHSLRSIHEPNNFSRHIHGFDTFAGFPSVSPLDGNDPETKIGGLAVDANWESELEAILDAHQKLSMRPDHRRFSLTKGDVSETLPAFLESHPHCIFAMLYLDLDLYEPTRDVLKALWPKVAKGGIIVFDQINLDLFPGETLALLEGIDLNAHGLHRSSYAGYQAYVVK